MQARTSDSRGVKLDSGHAFRQAIQSDMRKIAQSAIDILNRVQQLFSAGIFGEIGHCAAPHGAIDIFAAPVVREHDDAGVGKLLAQLR